MPKKNVIPLAAASNPFHVLPSGDRLPEICNAYIESPTRSKIKYEIDKRSGFMTVSRILHSSVHFPANYGFIPQTYSRDHDPLDILVRSQEAVVPGCVMKARPVGMLRMFDQGKEDIKIIAVHVDDPIFASYNDISQLPPHVLREMQHFFEIYKELEDGKNPVVEDFRGRVDAHRAIRDAAAAYQKYRKQLLQCEFPDY